MKFSFPRFEREILSLKPCEYESASMRRCTIYITCENSSENLCWFVYIRCLCLRLFHDRSSNRKCRFPLFRNIKIEVRISISNCTYFCIPISNYMHFCSRQIISWNIVLNLSVIGLRKRIKECLCFYVGYAKYFKV